MSILRPLAFSESGWLRLNGEQVSDEQADDYYSQRLDAGLATLQQCDVALALAARQSSTFRQQLLAALKSKGVDPQELREIVQQYADTLAEDTVDVDKACIALGVALTPPRIRWPASLPSDCWVTFL